MISRLVIFTAGAFAVYLEPWHADIFEFLDLRKNHGKVCLVTSKLKCSLLLFMESSSLVACTQY